MDERKDPRLTIRMASGGTIVFQLCPRWAPNACASVIALARAGAYDGMGIERITNLKYQVKDLRMFSENDTRFLEEFTSAH